MKWFRETFIPSFDERLEDRNGIYITEKQADICLRYMKESKYFGGRFYIIIGDYQYTMVLMKKGYGKLYKTDKRTAYH